MQYTLATISLFQSGETNNYAVNFIVVKQIQTYANLLTLEHANHATSSNNTMNKFTLFRKGYPKNCGMVSFTCASHAAFNLS